MKKGPHPSVEPFLLAVLGTNEEGPDTGAHGRVNERTEPLWSRQGATANVRLTKALSR